MSTGNGRLKVENNTVHEEYFIKDHLGNTRSTLRSAPTAQSFTYQQQNHYYAFGLTIEDLSSPISPENSNRITYNGKEFDKELNWYHYGARFYDPQVGRWWVTDPLNQLHSAYNYVANNPLSLTDTDGRDIGFINKGPYAFLFALPNLGNTIPNVGKAGLYALAKTSTGLSELQQIANDSKTLVVFAQYKGDPDRGALTRHVEGVKNGYTTNRIDLITEYIDGTELGKAKTMNLSDLTGIDSKKLESYDEIHIIFVNTHSEVMSRFESDLPMPETSAFMIRHEIKVHVIDYDKTKSTKQAHIDYNGQEHLLINELNMIDGTEATKIYDELKY